MTEIILKDKLKLAKQTFDELTKLIADPYLDINSEETFCRTWWS